MRVDVVVPAHDAETYLRSTIDGILAQDLAANVGDQYHLNSIFIVDDGSQDQTRSIAASYGHPVRVVSTPGVGNVAARNAALEQSDAELIAFCDADDIWEPGKLTAQLPAFSDPEVVASCTALRQIDSAGRCMTTKGATWSESTIRSLLLDEFVMPVPLSSWVVRRSAFNVLDRSLPVGADLELASRLVRAGRIHYAAQPLLRYRVHGGSISASRAVEQQLVRRYLRVRYTHNHSVAYDAWRQDYRPTWRDKRKDAAVYHFRTAGQKASDGLRVRAFVHLTASGLLDIRELTRKLHALRST